MSDLTELIKINRNIEKQNDEIIRLLKKIAGENDQPEDKFSLDGNLSNSFIKMKVDDIVNQAAEITEEFTEPEPLSGLPLDVRHDVGEVMFIEGTDMFRLTVKNNETTLDNLTSSSQPDDFALQEIVANESVKNNRSLDVATVILNQSQSKNLAETLRICVENGARNVYVPLKESKQLMWSLEAIRAEINVEFYKDDQHLISLLFC